MKSSIKKLVENTVFTIILVSVVLLVYSLVNMPKAKHDDYIDSEEAKDVSANSEIDKEIQELFKNKNSAILKKDTKTLESIYDIENKLGTWAYENEVKKIKYIEDWSNKQGVEFIDINPTVLIKNITETDNKFSVSLLCSTEYKYKYTGDKAINISRVGTHHVMDLIKKDEKLHIIKEWYDDPFAGIVDTESYEDEEITKFIADQSYLEPKNLSQYRKKSVDYANKFAGAASKEKYGFKYNDKYINYNSKGGDCTNFISQVILEGGFEKDGTWTYNSGGGSKTWVNAEAFKNHLIYSGRGQLVSSGDYKTIYKDAYRLELGDVISYEKEGKISHTAVITGFDSKGYPLITCHNTDRNDVPFDIGFNDKNIKFHLINMNYQE